MSAGRFPLTSWLETYRETVGGEGTITTGVLTYSGLGDGGRQLWSDWTLGPLIESGDAHISVRAEGTTLKGNLGKGSASIRVSATGRLNKRASGQYPITSWLEEYRERAGSEGLISNGLLISTSLGDGGRQLWSDWVFDPVLEGDSRIQCRAFGTTLIERFGRATASIQISAKGHLRKTVLGQYPITSWLETYRETVGGEGSIVTGVLCPPSLGDGGRQAWSEWVFGPNPSLHGETRVLISGSAILQLGLGTGSAKIGVKAKGNLHPFGMVAWDPYQATNRLRDVTTFSNNYLTTSFSYDTVGGSLQGTKSHAWGKWYFELNIAVTNHYYGLGLTDKNLNVWYYIVNQAFTGVSQIKSNIETLEVSGSGNEDLNIGVAVDIDKGLVWFRRSGVWLLDGDPSNDLNPVPFTASSASLKGIALFPYLLINLNQNNKTATANFGDSAFTYDAPVGFLPWSADEPLSPADSEIQVRASAIELSIRRTLLGPANSAISLSTEASTLTLVESYVLSGNTTISLVGAGELTVPQTLLEGDAPIALSASGTLSAQPEYSIHATITFTLSGSLGGTHYAISVHDTTYRSIPVAMSLHENQYGTHSEGVHHTAYESEVGRVSSVHESSWSRSALAVHNAIYALLDAATSTAAFAVHDSLWASVGASASSTFAVHDSAWDSFVQIPGYAVHEVSWASSGGTSMVLSVHESGWASVGSSSASAFTVHESSWNSTGAGSTTSVFTVHDTGWGTGFTPYSVHTSTYQSVVESLAVHHTAWNSFVVPADFAVHEARYRSYSIDPQFILANAYIEPDILLVAASVTADEDSPYYQCEVELRDSKKYSYFNRDQPFILHLFADEYHFVVDSRNFSRTIDDDGNYQETATISGLSPLCLKAAPRSTPVTKTWTTPTYASALVEELIGPVTWNLVDWLIPGYRLAAESADPFDVAQKIVTAAGGLIESQPDGSVVVRHRWPTSIAELGSATLVGTLYETAIYAAQEQPTQDALMNRIRILDSDAGFQDRLEYVPNKLDDGERDDPWNGIMYAYPSPWRENLRIATTRGSKIQLGLQGESVLTVDGDEAETITFESGQSSARYPIMTLNSFEWLDENLGGLTFSAYSTTLEAGAEGSYYGHSLAKIAYTSRRLQVPVACSPSTGEIEAQFLLLENQDGR